MEKIAKLIELLDSMVGVAYPGGCFSVVTKNKTYSGFVGNKATVPLVISNDVDTIYDMASCTKVICTTTCIMKLLELGKIRLYDSVSTYLPRFKHSDVVIWDLLTHTSGLPAGIAGVTKIKTKEEALDKLFNIELIYPKNTKILYSDLGFILLGLIVEKVSGMNLNEFSKENIFIPLEMYDTMFKPNDIDRCAPTEERNDDIVKGMVKGYVHDELSYILGGICGHAGLFSTASDISHFIEMILNNGKYHDKQILSKASIDLLFTPQVEEKNGISLNTYKRSLGWIVQGEQSSASDLASKETILHTGFTGTNIFIDRINKVGFTLLTNRVHPTRKNNLLIPFRAKVGNFIIANFGGENNE